MALPAILIKEPVYVVKLDYILVAKHIHCYLDLTTRNFKISCLQMLLELKYIEQNAHL